MSARPGFRFLQLFQKKNLVEKMAEQQEEMSMNEILSSIKNILVENENPTVPSSSGLTPPEPHPAGNENIVKPETEVGLPDSFEIDSDNIKIDDIKFDENNDILELSPEMAVELEKNSQQMEKASETGHMELPENLADINLTPEIVDDKGDDEPEPVEEDISFDGLMNQKSEQDATAEENSAPVIDVESDPYYEEPAGEQHPAESNISETDTGLQVSADTESTTDYISEEPSAEPEIKMPEMSWPEPVEMTKEPETEPEFDIAAETEAEAEQSSFSAELPSAGLEPETPMQKEPEIENVPSVDEEVADVSASIINNFAKLFAKEETPATEQAKPALEIAPVSENVRLGDSSRTLEDMLKSAIQGLVADWVSGAKSNIDLYDMVSKEVARQTKVWLDANLPAVVEAVVKKEIERVMVKVGRS